MNCPILLERRLQRRSIFLPQNANIQAKDSSVCVSAAEEVAIQLRPSITKFHSASGGSIEAIGLLFSESTGRSSLLSSCSICRLQEASLQLATNEKELPVAKQPLPPQVICQILGLDEETVKEAFDTGSVPSATEEQLFQAVKKSVDPEDTAETYAPV